MKTKIKKLLDSLTKALFREPQVDGDWDRFEAMSADELRQEFDRLFKKNPRCDSLRRLCFFVAAKWKCREAPVVGEE